MKCMISIFKWIFRREIKIIFLMIVITTVVTVSTFGLDNISDHVPSNHQRIGSMLSAAVKDLVKLRSLGWERNTEWW